MVNQILKLNERELQTKTPFSASWHQEYSDSAYIFIGNLPRDLIEEDILRIFSQYGVPVDIRMPRELENESSGLKGYNYHTDSATGSIKSSDQNARYIKDNIAGSTLGNNSTNKKYHSPEDTKMSRGKEATLYKETFQDTSNSTAFEKPVIRNKGFAFLKYENQLSTVLAVDNLNGITIYGRSIRVDHTYFKPKLDEDGNEVLNQWDIKIKDKMAKEDFPVAIE